MYFSGHVNNSVGSHISEMSLNIHSNRLNARTPLHMESDRVIIPMSFSSNFRSNGRLSNKNMSITVANSIESQAMHLASLPHVSIGSSYNIQSPHSRSRSKNMVTWRISILGVQGYHISDGDNYFAD
jgi:hypothetical protein